MNKTILGSFLIIFTIVSITPGELKEKLISYGKLIIPSYPGLGLLVIIVGILCLFFFEEITTFFKQIKIKQNI